MILSEFKKLFLRDLDKVADECAGYVEEKNLWIKVDGINNTAGNLMMHICGNLQHFVGAVLDATGYERQRDFEFNGKLTQKEIQHEIETTKHVIGSFFDNASEGLLSQDYPLIPFGYTMTVRYFLMHLQGHLNYHLGQINYHRRILS